MENHSYGDIIGHRSQAPYINSLASECGLAANYHSISHPSLPNYLAATSGLSRGHLPILSWFDCHPSLICHTSAASIFGQGETWKAYEESMPARCDTVQLRPIRREPQPPAVLRETVRVRQPRRPVCPARRRPGRPGPARVLVHHPQHHRRHA